jgi:GR25 family glycosyltransferase involved in LPS biosynthesis
MEFIKKGDIDSALSFIQDNKGNVNIEILFKFFHKIFPHNKRIISEIINHANENGFSDKRFLYKVLMSNDDNSQAVDSRFALWKLCAEEIQNDFNYYNYNLISTLPNNNFKTKLITLTMTTCKRFDLFTQTVNSFLNCCLDINLVSEFFVVDDNSSENDRKRMKELYPFINFYFKNENEKGHAKSLNIIHTKYCNENTIVTPYIFHLEDDWKFFEKRNYLTECLEVINSNSSYGQCLINKNYFESYKHDFTVGGILKTNENGISYIHHEFTENEEQKQQFLQKYGSGNQVAYWPHFSLRPSLLRVDMLRKIGQFSSTPNHFEREYAERYFNAGYRSAMLNGYYSLHIGRLTSERWDSDKPNAYQLNQTAQFGVPSTEVVEIKPKTKSLSYLIHLINLDRRPDRLENFIKTNKHSELQLNRFSAIDGNVLKPTLQIQQIFEYNDYNMRRGMVGCALSHIKLWLELLQDDQADFYLILEDDAVLCEKFSEKFNKLIYECPKDWEIVFLGNHTRKENYDRHTQSPFTRKNRIESLRDSVGGTFGYIINKSGAKKVLEFINKYSMVNCIDTMMQKSADDTVVYYLQNNLVFSEFYNGLNNPDTDIQKDYNSLTLSLDDRFAKEMENYDNVNFITKFTIAEYVVKDNNLNNIIVYKDINVENIKTLRDTCIHPYYTLNDHAIFVIPNTSSRRFEKELSTHYFQRLNKGWKSGYDINDCL